MRKAASIGIILLAFTVASCSLFKKKTKPTDAQLVIRYINLKAVYNYIFTTGFHLSTIAAVSLLSLLFWTYPLLNYFSIPKNGKDKQYFSVLILLGLFYSMYIFVYEPYLVERWAPLVVLCFWQISLSWEKTTNKLFKNFISFP